MTRLLCFFVLIACAVAQEPSGRVQFDWSKLAAKAVEKVDVTLDGPALEMATKFLSEGKEDEAKAKQLVQALRGIYVRTFEFEKEGEYSEADLNAIRSQLRGPQWTRIIDMQEKHESLGIYLKVRGSAPDGIVVLTTEAKSLAFVQILGPVDLSTLSELSGKFGIPKVALGSKPAPKPIPKPAPKKDD
jgi:Domain of unknown function (DUF4252)